MADPDLDPAIAADPPIDFQGHDVAFLTEYCRGLSPAHALRRAQLAANDPSSGTLGDEANWGAFMVVGNWRCPPACRATSRWPRAGKPSGGSTPGSLRV